MSKYNIGDMVSVRLKRYNDNSGCAKYSPDHPAYLKETTVVECRISVIGIAGVPDIYALSFVDTGHPVGLPFWEDDFL